MIDKEARCTSTLSSGWIARASGSSLSGSGAGRCPARSFTRQQQLTADQAGLIAVGEPTIEEALDQALTKAGKVVKHTVEATTDEITSELQEALKSFPGARSS